MGTLSYTATVSIDGYAADSDGDFQWSGPGDQVFQFHVERMGAISHEVLGRKTYQLMAYWDAEPEDGAWTAEEQEFAKLWRGLERTVVSTTLGPQDLTFSWDRLVPSLDTEALRQNVDDAVARSRSSAPPRPPTPSVPGWCGTSASLWCPRWSVGDSARCPPTRGSTWHWPSTGCSTTEQCSCITGRGDVPGQDSPERQLHSRRLVGR